MAHRQARAHGSGQQQAEQPWQVVPRQIGMYLAKKMTARSLPESGRRFGGRDHSTVLHAVRKIEDQIKTDDKLAREVALLIRLVEQG